MMVSPMPHGNMMSMGTIPENQIVETVARLYSSPFRADELSDISFAAEATDDLEINNDNDDFRQEYESQGLFIVEVEKTKHGFGFNIVGGIDNPHFPGDVGIFISSVNINSKSYGIVQAGDKILSFNGVNMTYITHDNAIDEFKKVKVGEVAKMLVDRETVNSEDITQTLSYATTSNVSHRKHVKEDLFKDGDLDVSGVMASSDSKGRLSSQGLNTIVDRLRGKKNFDDEDTQSVTSYAPSTHSIIDDVPRTPRKPLSILDPRNNSLITEMLYVSIGIGALSVSGFLLYRFIRGKLYSPN